MNIAVIGRGNVGGRLSDLWSQAAHQVITAGRNGKPTTAEAASNADVIALCVPGGAAEEALSSCGEVTGKIVIDCTNPLKPGLDGLEYGGTTSTAERLQTLRPEAKLVKAFNSIGAGLLGRGVADGFYCGDDMAAKGVVGELVSAAGLRPVDVGSLCNARYLEALAMLWIDLAVNQGRGGTFSFHLIPHEEGGRS